MNKCVLDFLEESPEKGLVALQYTDHEAHYRSNYPQDFYFALS